MKTKEKTKENALASAPTDPRDEWKASILFREEIDPAVAEAIASGEAVQYASQRLGYKHPERYAKQATSQLAGALRSLKIKPFNESSVERYMDEEIEGKKRGTAFSKWATKSVVDSYGNVEDFAVLVMVLSGLLLAIGLSFGIYSMVEGGRWGIALALSIVPAAILTTFTAAVRVGGNALKVWQWREYNLSGYEGQVPAFALETARKIHTHAPDTKFSICELQLGPKVEDPFLIARDPQGNKYYVEVWKEPRFDQLRTI